MKSSKVEDNTTPRGWRAVSNPTIYQKQQKLKQTHISFAPTEGQLTTQLYYKHPRYEQKQNKIYANNNFQDSKSQNKTNSAGIYGLSLVDTLTTLTVDEALGIRIGADKTAILPQKYSNDRELQYVELFGRIGAVRYDDAEFGRGSILMTLVDDGYIEGIKILAWKQNLQGFGIATIAVGNFYRFIGKMTLNTTQREKFLRSLWMSEISYNECECLRGQALSKGSSPRIKLEE
ncbi:MAG: hypothetical protein EZS28_019867 [Streblomastix strix]|uniref:Uncharacterized protein n=1 Tax=Streblomastix strix TaxID=222440 RepID=A0A5J4VPN1_9EUKA|nr:MAG: hypothetical protein EZS28_019867 [Streblomastix strix]